MNEPLLTKLEGMIKLLDSQVTKEDFVTAFENVLKVVVQIEKKTSDAVTALEQTYQQMISRMQNDHSSTLSDMKKQVDGLFVGDKVKAMQDEHSKRMSMVDMKMKKVKDGRTPTKEELLSLIKPLIPPPVKGQDGKVINVQDVYDKLLAEVKRSIPKKQGMRRVPIIQRVNLTSQVNGVTTTFTVPKDTVAVLGVFSTQFPVTFDSADFSLAGTTLTLNTVVQSGQTLFALTENLFYA